MCALRAERHVRYLDTVALRVCVRFVLLECYFAFNTRYLLTQTHYKFTMETFIELYDWRPAALVRVATRGRTRVGARGAPTWATPSSLVFRTRPYTLYCDCTVCLPSVQSYQRYHLTVQM